MYKISITIEIVSLFAVKQMHVHWQYTYCLKVSCKKFINHLLPFYIDLSSRKLFANSSMFCALSCPTYLQLFSETYWPTQSIQYGILKWLRVDKV